MCGCPGTGDSVVVQVEDPQGGSVRYAALPDDAGAPSTSPLAWLSLPLSPA